MPNKTIYVSDDDLPLFERAQELSGSNLSSAIIRALRRYIEIEEAGQRGHEEITLIVNSQGAHRHKRFIGQRLARWLQPTEDGKGTRILNIYHTAKNRYALHTRIIADWELEWGDPDITRHPKNWAIADGILKRFTSWGYDDWDTFKDAGDYTLEVFESLDDLKPHISSEFYKAVTLAMAGPDIEELDI